MKKEIVLTGITTTGTPHIGNFVGAIRPAIELSSNDNILPFFFLADYHSIIKSTDAKTVEKSTIEVAATWLACGLDPEKVIFYRQSDIPEILELTWILTCLTAKGLMNRAHAYKAAVDQNIQEKETDEDKGITMGLFSYPILMAADILMFKANRVPVGKDQVQHIEMTRDIASRFNFIYKKLLVLPEAIIDEKTAVLRGLDGRKMSKSYGNTLPLFENENILRKLIMKIQTDSTGKDEPKNFETCILFEIYSAFAKKNEIALMKEKYQKGISWGEVKEELFLCLNNILSPYRTKYNELITNPNYIKEVLKKGGEKARGFATPYLKEIKSAVGIK